MWRCGNSSQLLNTLSKREKEKELWGFFSFSHLSVCFSYILLNKQSLYAHCCGFNGVVENENPVEKETKQPDRLRNIWNTIWFCFVLFFCFYLTTRLLLGYLLFFLGYLRLNNQGPPSHCLHTLRLGHTKDEIEKIQTKEREREKTTFSAMSIKESNSTNTVQCWCCCCGWRRVRKSQQAPSWALKSFPRGRRSAKLKASNCLMNTVWAAPKSVETSHHMQRGTVGCVTTSDFLSLSLSFSSFF